MSYFKKVQPISDIINKDLRKIVGQKSIEQLDAIHIIQQWRQILGPTMSKYSTGEKFQNGALCVRITSAILRNDLFMQRTQLIEKLNQQIGKKILYAITFY